MNTYTRRVAREGVETNDGRLIDVGALTWDPDPVPVLRGHLGQPSHIVGVARDLRRADDGWVTATVVLTSGDLAPGEVLQLDTDSNEVVVGAPLVIRAGKVRGFHIGTSPCWEGMDDAG